MPQKAIIIGAGPAGLTAAYELLKRTNIIPIVIEKSGDIGGISKTVNYKGNRIDIGGHRFFSKSDRVMNWWLNIMPIEPFSEKEFSIHYQNKTKEITVKEILPRQSSTDLTDKVMLVRNRLSRIYFLRKFFHYPIKLSFDTLHKLGVSRTIKILFSYCSARMAPRKPETTLEDFFINRFGRELYRLFFKDYTEKVWGISCNKISAEWGAQRVKGISIAKAISHAVRSLRVNANTKDIHQKGTETSLIEKFLYPKYGPGQLWEEVARQIIDMGGTVLLHHDVQQIRTENSCVTSIETRNIQTGGSSSFEGDYFFSTMPVKELIASMGNTAPENVRDVASKLEYRDFITVGVLLKNMPPPGVKLASSEQEILPDTWVYIQEKDVKVGRIQIFNNWSPFMVKDASTVWIGMEYFCNKEDEFWLLSDEGIQNIAIAELVKMSLAKADDVLDTTTIRMEKTYPAYFGSYDRFDEIRHFTDQIENLFLIGRNGMHRYNNSDHSMLTAMVSVDNIISGELNKANIWSINTEQEYHEEKTTMNTKEKADLKRKKEDQSFASFLFHSNRNTSYLRLSLIAIIIQFAIFKYWYPFAGFINGDSYVYLETAYHNMSINTYPVGYSNFLRLLSVFTKSDTVVVGIQYMLLQCSILFFLFTLFYFYKFSKAAQIILLLFFVLNPVFLYIGNYISSDALFISLSLIWLGSLVWILRKPSLNITILHCLILIFTFTVRYNALYYPFLSILIIFISKQSPMLRTASVLLIVTLLGSFILFNMGKYHKLAGIRQFSPFSGWQIANNALYAYRNIDKSDRKPLPNQFDDLDKIVRKYFDTTRGGLQYPQELQRLNTWYMWNPRSPLQIFMNQKTTGDSSHSQELKKWASVGPHFSAYGSAIIRNYPHEYFTYFIWPNMVRFYTPPLEFLQQYSTGSDSVQLVAQAWFGYSSNKIRARVKDFKVRTLDFLPIIVACINILFIFALFSYLVLWGRTDKSIRQIILLVLLLWVLNFFFSVLASPISLRFQVFPFIANFSITVFIVENIINKLSIQQQADSTKGEVADYKVSL